MDVIQLLCTCYSIRLSDPERASSFPWFVFGRYPSNLSPKLRAYFVGWGRCVTPISWVEAGPSQLELFLKLFRVMGLSWVMGLGAIVFCIVVAAISFLVLSFF